MIVDRKTGFAPKVTQLAQDMAGLQGPCIGCEGCRGLCLALIEALTVPDVILSKTKA